MKKTIVKQKCRYKNLHKYIKCIFVLLCEFIYLTLFDLRQLLMNMRPLLLYEFVSKHFHDLCTSSLCSLLIALICVFIFMAFYDLYSQVVFFKERSYKHYSSVNLHYTHYN